MSNLKKPRSLELFFVDGDPEGMLTATIPFQWSGHVLVSNRTQLRDALQRTEVGRPGVYLLIGENEEGEPLLYIGESDDIGQRIKNHDSNKQWWTTAVFITSNGDQLNKAHVKYLESRLIEKAKQVNKIKLDNGTNPPLNPLSEAARSHMEDFLDNIFLVLPALRFDFFLESTRTKASLKEATQKEAPVFVLNVPLHGLTARAQLIDGHFVVEEGSIAQPKWLGDTTVYLGYSKLHEQLLQQGVLVHNGDKAVFAKNYAFSSPSAAGAMITGRATNGQTAWKTIDGKTYREWEATELRVSSNNQENAA